MPDTETSPAGSGATTELARDFRLFDITMVGVGAMVGAGIFALTGIAAGAAGPGLILAFALNGILTLCTAMVYAEIGSAIPGAGGGYLWTKFGFPAPGAFLAGWMDWLAHAVAGSLYAVVFGTYAVWGMQTILGWGTAPTGAEDGGMGTLFGIEAIWIAKGLTLLVCLAFIYINYRGSAETGKAGNIITVAKICTIGIFIAFGVVALMRSSGGDAAGATLEDKFSPFLPTGASGVLVAMGLTFIAFEGYEIIVQAGEEVVEPRRNIPRAVFWSLAIVIPIYLLVAIVCLGAMSIPTTLIGVAGGFEPSETWRYLAALGETGVAEAANQFMPWGSGAVLLVLGAILSTMSALNATTYSSTRVSFAMGRDRNLPGFMATISPRTRTPVAVLLASGALITFVAVWLDAERVAAATCVMFLLVFAGVNLAAITIRRKYGDRLRYGYVMPLFPLVPVVAIIGQLGVAVFLFIHEPLSLYLTAGWIVVGLVMYYTYSRHQEHELRATPVIFEQRPVASDTRYRVLVPIANPANAGPLIDLAARLARAREASIVALHVVTVPEQLPYYATERFVKDARAVVDSALGAASLTGVPAEGLVRVGRHPARSIIDTLIDRRCGMLVMGWSGPKYRRKGLSARRPLIGSQIDHVLLHADADTIVMRGKLPAEPQRIAIPLANPRQGRFAIEVAEAVAGPATVLELIHVVPADESPEQRGDAVMQELFGDAASTPRSPRRELTVTMNAIAANNVIAAVAEAADDADLLITGASAETWLHRHAFTHFHYELARRHPGPMLLVKLRTGIAKFASQKTIEFFRSAEPAR